RALPAAGARGARPRGRCAVALPAAVAAPLRGLCGVEPDPAAAPARANERRPARPRAVPRVADAAPPAGDAALVPPSRLRPEPVRAGGARRRDGYERVSVTRSARPYGPEQRRRKRRLGRGDDLRAPAAQFGPEEDGDRGSEREQLLDRHDDAGEMLVAERRQA